jgi:hypothetical protein
MEAENFELEKLLVAAAVGLEGKIKECHAPMR